MEAKAQMEDNIKTDLKEMGCDAGTSLTLLKMGPTASLCKGCKEPMASLKVN